MNLVELVPRELDAVVQKAKDVVAQFPEITGINIPDVIRLPHRSHDVVPQLVDIADLVVPHIRVIDRPLDELKNIAKTLVKAGIKGVLLITGDKPTDPNWKTYKASTLDAIASVKGAYPGLKVYAGLDPYRTSFKNEIAYTQQKLEAGVDGIFTQPFFDIELAEKVIKALPKTNIFLGVSPVITEKSKIYWETVNKVQFPEGFELNLSYNCQLGKSIVALAKKHDLHTYHMPVRVDVFDYLNGVFH